MKKDTSCLNCKHNSLDNVFICDAFPNGIPIEIITGDVTHFDPLPGDHGVQFEAKEEEGQ